MQKYLRYSAFAIAFATAAFIVYHYQTPSSVAHVEILPTFYGDIIITEPVLVDLIAHPAMQRLKKVRQYGTCHFVKELNLTEYTRWEHSIGVFSLLHKYGAPLKEQIAGLLHDVSHTVFSHVGDFIFNHHSHHSSYQDDIHSWYLVESGISKVLEKHGFTVQDVLHKKGDFPALECDLPDVCADRLEYNLQGGVLYGLIDSRDVPTIIDHTHFEDRKWIFSDAESAKKIALVSLHLSSHLWGSAENNVIYTWTSQALQRMIDIGEITMHDIHFGTDDDMWEKMKKSSDAWVRTIPEKIVHPYHYYSEGNTQDYSKKFVSKFRGINPLIKTESGLKRLTEIDPSYKQEYDNVRAIMHHGWHITYLESHNNQLC